MDEQQAPVQPQAPPTPRQRREAAGAVRPRAGRADELDALLRDVEVLRRVLETDLSLAASATEVGALDVLADVVDADRAELARFSGRARAHLGSARGPCRSALAPLTTALAAVLAVQLSGSDEVPLADPGAVWAQLAGLVDPAAPLPEVREAAAGLHRAVEGLLEQGTAERALARTALAVLRSEQESLLALPDRAAVSDLLAEVEVITDRLLGVVAAALRAPEPRPDR